MIPPLRKLPFVLAVVTGLFLGRAVAVAQVAEIPEQPKSAFKGLHRNLGINGGPETVTITDGKIYTRVTGREYRERGYAPAFESLPTIIVQRLPIRGSVPTDDRD